MEALREVGKEITLIAQASKENASSVLRYSLPASIQALGSRFSVEALREFRVWVAGLPPALLSGMSSLSAFESGEILSLIGQPPAVIRGRMDYIRSNGFAEDTAVDKFVVRSMMGVDDPDNRFEDARKKFNERWKQWAGKTEPPAIIVQNASFRVKAGAEVTVPTLISGKRLDNNVLQSISRRLAPPSTNLEVTILQELSRLSGVPFQESLTERQRNDFVIQSFRALGTRPEDFSRAVGMTMPLLPRVTGMSLPTLTPEPSPTEARGFLDATKVFFDGHLPEVLQTYDATPATIQAAKTRLPIAPINAELGKFARGKATQEEIIELQATKTVLDAYYDALGQNCICRYGFDLRRPEFQPIRLVNTKTGEQLGVVYALRGVVEGNPAMILAGIEPRKRFAYAVNSGQFMKGLLDNLERVAKTNGLAGGVYTNVGQDGTDDGRIAQWDVVRGAIEREKKGYVRLERKEQIKFPTDFRDPIKYLWKLR